MTKKEEEVMKETDKARGQGSIFDEVPKLLEGDTKAEEKVSGKISSLKPFLPSQKEIQV